MDMSHNFNMHLLGGLAAASVFWLGACAQPQVAAEAEEVEIVEELVVVEVVGPETDNLDTSTELDCESLALASAGDPEMIAHVGCSGSDFSKPSNEQEEQRKQAKSVRAGLDWLEKHQSPDGYWDADRFMEQDARKDLPASDGPGNLLNDVGLTGLALLAIYGEGNTLSTGPRKDSVRAGLSWLMDNQDDQGLFGKDVGNATLYNHAIATLAMSEAFFLANQSPRLKRPVHKAVKVIQNARNPYGAWRYSRTPNGDSDTSVTGWMVFALTSAKSNGVEIHPDVFAGAETWFKSMQDKETGRVGYAWGDGGGGPGSFTARGRAQEVTFPAEKSEALTAISLLARIFMTDRERFTRWQDHPDYEMMKKQVELIAAKPPVWNEENGSIDFYYWYFATLAMYQWGGEEGKTWLDTVSKVLLENQRMEHDYDNFYGSWDPVGPWCEEGGRIYSTALCTMILELHFRNAEIISNE